MQKFFDQDVAKTMMQSWTEWYGMASRMTERNVQQSMSLLNECMSLGMQQCQSLAGIKKYEDAAKLNMNFSSEMSQKAVAYVKELGDAMIENAHMLQKWVEKISHQACCQQGACSEHTKTTK